MGLKVFLVALAIVDDIGAILIIALFYSQGIQPAFLVAAAGILLLAFLLNRAGESRPWPYLVLGIPLWLALLKAGIHPTIAGVLLALSVPASAKMTACKFYPPNTEEQSQWTQGDLQCSSPPALTHTEYSENKHSLETLSAERQAPLQRLEHGLHPWVTYGILPLFALANAGVYVPLGQISNALGQPLTLGIMAGLFVGKPLGITLATWTAVQLGWAKLPTRVSFRQIHAAGVLGGIGFTMSVFISLLGFREPNQVASAKLGILLASGLSALVGVGLLWFSSVSGMAVELRGTPEE